MRKNRRIKGSETSHSGKREKAPHKELWVSCSRTKPNTATRKQTKNKTQRTSTNKIGHRAKDRQHRVPESEFLQRGLVLSHNPYLCGLCRPHLPWLSRNIPSLVSVVYLFISRVNIWVSIEIVLRDMSIMVRGDTHVIPLSKVCLISIRRNHCAILRGITISLKRTIRHIQVSSDW